jgi:HEAT repeat protein
MVAALALVACGTVARADTSAAQSRAGESAPVVMDEFERQFFELNNRCSLAGSLRATAAQYFVDHAEQTHARFLAAAERTPSAAVLMVLGRMGREESVPLLERLLAGGEELLAWDAGSALGANRTPAALGALLRQVGARDKNVVYGATLGLMARGDAAACPRLLRLAAEPRAGDVHYYLVQAAGRLDCWSRAQLTQIAAADRDPAVRDLATRLIRERR